MRPVLFKTPSDENFQTSFQSCCQILMLRSPWISLTASTAMLTSLSKVFGWKANKSPALNLTSNLAFTLESTDQQIWAEYGKGLLAYGKWWTCRTKFWSSY